MTILHCTTWHMNNLSATHTHTSPGCIDKLSCSYCLLTHTHAHTHLSVIMCCCFSLIHHLTHCLSSSCVCPAASSGSVTINSDGTVQILVEEAATLDSFDLQVLALPCSCVCVAITQRLQHCARTLARMAVPSLPLSTGCACPGVVYNYKPSLN